MYYTYLLRCADGSLYAGITTDPARRLREHLTGKKGAKFMRTRAPAGFAALWTSADRAAASRLENALKKLTHAQKEALAAEPAALAGSLPKFAGEDYLPVPAVEGEGKELLWDGK